MLCEGYKFEGTANSVSVLILVLMEDALRDQVISIPGKRVSLNPCSNGRCSASFDEFVSAYKNAEVLILVLMEDALRDVEANEGSTLASLS